MVPSLPLIEPLYLARTAGRSGVAICSGQGYKSVQISEGELGSYVLRVPRSTRELFTALSRLFDAIEAWTKSDEQGLDRAGQQLMLACQFRTPNMSEEVHAGVTALVTDPSNWSKDVCGFLKTHLRALQELHARLFTTYLWIANHERAYDGYLITGDSLAANRALVRALLKAFDKHDTDLQRQLLPNWLCGYINTQIRPLWQQS